MNEAAEFRELMIASGLNKRAFVNRIDDKLRGEVERLPKRDKALRGLVARYGWTPVRQAAAEVAVEASK